MASQPKGWEGFPMTHIGSNHAAKNMVNQDHCVCEGSHANSPAYAAVSDGHSSAPRGDTGSRIACDLVVGIVQKLRDGDIFRELRDEGGPIKPAALRQQLIERWRAAVEKDFDLNPLSECEKESARSLSKKGLTKQNVIWRMYGATLLAVILTEQEAVYVQLGDGDIFCAYSPEDISRPFSEDVRQFANETFSFCSLNAFEEDICRIKVIPFKERHPIFVWLSTDGIGNSYPDNASFFKLISDSLNALTSEGLQQFKPKLKRHFDVLYAEGCGDDFSVALLHDATERKVKVKPPTSEAEHSDDCPGDKNTNQGFGLATLFGRTRTAQIALLGSLALIVLLLAVFLRRSGQNELQIKDEEIRRYKHAATELIQRNKELGEEKAAADKARSDLTAKLEEQEVELIKLRKPSTVRSPEEDSLRVRLEKELKDTAEFQKAIKLTQEILGMLAQKQNKAKIVNEIQGKLMANPQAANLAPSLIEIMNGLIPDNERLEIDEQEFKRGGKLSSAHIKKLRLIINRFGDIPGIKVAVYSQNKAVSETAKATLEKNMESAGLERIPPLTPYSQSSKADTPIFKKLVEWGKLAPKKVIVYIWDDRPIVP